ncbi:nSTAND1 domain-containing NTPase [Nonomuraea roseola]|uniref:Novel STAND NTPase 1 domain-containing protein n=1 Tax=Nonomuraea roseola TaxID=46179 RepID=A0ABV5PTJ9_9ACTN
MLTGCGAGPARTAAAPRPLPALADLLAANTVIVHGMSSTETRRAVEGPAQRAGLSLEPGLLDELVSETSGALPLLSPPCSASGSAAREPPSPGPPSRRWARLLHRLPI